MYLVQYDWHYVEQWQSCNQPACTELAGEGYFMVFISLAKAAETKIIWVALLPTLINFCSLFASLYSYAVNTFIQLGIWNALTGDHSIPLLLTLHDGCLRGLYRCPRNGICLVNPAQSIVLHVSSRPIQILCYVKCSYHMNTTILRHELANEDAQFSVTCPLTITVNADGNLTVCVSVNDVCVCGVLMSRNQNISFALPILIAWNVPFVELHKWIFVEGLLARVVPTNQPTRGTSKGGFIHLAILAYQRNRWTYGTKTS